MKNFHESIRKSIISNHLKKSYIICSSLRFLLIEKTLVLDRLSIFFLFPRNETTFFDSLPPPRGPTPFYSTPHRSSKQCFAARKEISRGTVHGLGVAFSSLETNSLGLSIRKPAAYVFGKNNSWGTSKPWSCEINCRVKRKKERKKLGF